MPLDFERIIATIAFGYNYSIEYIQTLTFSQLFYFYYFASLHLSLKAGPAGLDSRSYNSLLDGPHYSRRKYIERTYNIQKEALKLLSQEGKSVSIKNLQQKMRELSAQRGD